jgi:hypothetical protein
MGYPSYKSLLKHYESLPEETRNYFGHLPSLLSSNLPWKVIIAYQFIQVETLQNRIIYCGIIKLHRAHKEVAGSILHSLHITRDDFLRLFQNIYGKSLEQTLVDKLKVAEKARDKSVHGKQIKDAEARQAIGDVLDYANDINNYIEKIAGFRPVGSLKGFKGRLEPLEKETTRWLLKGLGLSREKN